MAELLASYFLPVDEKRHESLVAEILGRGAAAVASAPPPPSALQHVAGGQGQTNPSGFVGRPTSASVVGSDLALPGVRVPPQCPTCPGARLHESYECPRRYARLCREPCPGFDADGKAIPGAWSGTTLTAATRTAWLDYIKDHGLKRSKHVTSDVSF